MPKNMRFGKWEPINNNSTTFSLPIVKPFAVAEIVISDIDISMAKKSVEKKRHSQIVNDLQESVGAITITK